MCALTPEKENLIREALKNKVAEDSTAFVFSRRRLISSKQDFFKQLGKQPDSSLEFRFCQIDFLGFEDLTEDGLDDCPPTNLKYQIHCFFQFVDKRTDLSNSTDDFIKYILDLRCRINNTSHFVLDGKKHLVGTLSQTADIITNADLISGVEGHYAEFQVLVEVRE